jgi:hypothetical protein
MVSAYRYRPGRYRSPFRSRRGGGPPGIVVVAIAAAAAGVAGTPAVARHHPQPHAAAPAPAAPVTSASETAFFAAVLADLGAPDDAANAGSLAAWYPHEYATWPPRAANDPLDSTLAMPGSWNYNTFDGDLHVQEYPTASEGAQATALTLEGGYPLIVSALRSGSGICGAGFAPELGRWSGDGYQEVCP